MDTILIVGARSGIGEAMFLQLRAVGSRVISMSRDRPDAAVEEHIFYDVTSDLAIPSFEGPLDGLVYCPGSILLKPFRSLKVQDFMDDLRVHLFGAVRVLQHYLPALHASGHASVVMFSSVAATLGMPYHSSIAASKGAVEGLVRSLAAEWAPKIRINAIAPSLVKTPLSSRLTDTDVKITVAGERHPLKRIGRVEDIASMGCFLLSDQASWITGQVMHVDGGMSSLRL